MVRMDAFCKICLSKDQNNAPVEWCLECQKTLCSSCSQRHKQDNSSKDHESIPYDNYLKLPPFIRNINHNCSEHKKRYHHLCRKHDQLICIQCLETTHKLCEETPVLNDIVESVKTSNAFDSVTRDMRDTSEVMQKMITEHQKNLNEIQDQRKEMARNVEDTMDRITTYLKRLKRKMLSDIDHVTKENEQNIISTLDQLQTMASQINEILLQRELTEQHASNIQTFIGIKEMERIIEKTKLRLVELSDSGALDDIMIGIYQEKKVEKKNLKYAKLFGDIKVTRTSNNMSIETLGRQQSQITVPSKIPESLQLFQKVKLDKGYYCGCSTLPNGLVIITDYFNQQLKLINPDGTVNSILASEFKPFDVTAVDEKHVAVSHLEDGTLSIIDISGDKVISTLSTVHEVRGIFYSDGKIFLCVPGTGIKRLDLNKKTIDNVIIDENVTKGSHIVVCSGRICYTCPQLTNTVIVLDYKYNVVFKYQDAVLLSRPLGVTIDEHNNVYVTDFKSNKLIVISPDGKIARQLLSNSDGLVNPSAVHYCHHTNQLIVVNQDDELHRYSLRF